VWGSHESGLDHVVEEITRNDQIESYPEPLASLVFGTCSLGAMDATKCRIQQNWRNVKDTPVY
jgi:hypothetical protein